MSDQMEWLEKQQEFDDGFHGRKSPVQNAIEEELRNDVIMALQREIEAQSNEYDRALAELQETKALMGDFQRFVRHHARRLALAGSYDHKGKNEVLLSVIAALLDAAENAINVTRSDDVPF